MRQSTLNFRNVTPTLQRDSWGQSNDGFRPQIDVPVPKDLPSFLKKSEWSSDDAQMPSFFAFQQNAGSVPYYPPDQPQPYSLFNTHDMGACYGASGSVSFHPPVQATGSNFLFNQYRQYQGRPEAMWQQSSAPQAQNYNAKYKMFNSDGIAMHSPRYHYPQTREVLNAEALVSAQPRQLSYTTKVSIRRPQADYSKSLRSRPVPSPKMDDTSRKVTPSENRRVSVGDDKERQKRSRGTIFTSSSIQGLDHWSTMDIESPIVLEVVGILNSQVSELRTIRRKSFSLKDSQGHRISCQYYETDRKLCKMCRGKTYRCVGKYNQQKQVFHAYSVREANQEDARLYRRLIAVGKGAFRGMRAKP